MALLAVSTSLRSFSLAEQLNVGGLTLVTNTLLLSPFLFPVIVVHDHLRPASCWWYSKMCFPYYILPLTFPSFLPCSFLTSQRDATYPCLSQSNLCHCNIRYDLFIRLSAAGPAALLSDLPKDVLSASATASIGQMLRLYVVLVRLPDQTSRLACIAVYGRSDSTMSVAARSNKYKAIHRILR